MLIFVVTAMWVDGRNKELAEGVRFELTRGREPPAGFQDRCLKPLGHPSKLMNQSLSNTRRLMKEAFC